MRVPHRGAAALADRNHAVAGLACVRVFFQVALAAAASGAFQSLVSQDLVVGEGEVRRTFFFTGCGGTHRNG